MAGNKSGGFKIGKPVRKELKISDLNVTDLNIRFRVGQDIHGITSEVDTYNLKSMKMEILEAGCIHTAIDVWEMDDGKLVVLAGNRRTLAAQELLKDGSTPQNVLMALQKVPCNVYKGLTIEQANQLVNDQRALRFKRSEWVNYVWRLVGSGWTFAQIALEHYNQFASYTGNFKKLSEIESLPTHEERKKAILSWMKGGMDQGIIRAFNLGARVRKAFLLGEMEVDGIIKRSEKKEEQVGEVAEFGLSQGRLDELQKAKTEDATAGGWNPLTGGEKFNAVIEKFIKEDTTGTKEVKLVRMTTKALDEKITNSASRAAKAALRLAKGEIVAEYSDLDLEAGRMELILGVIQKELPNIKNKDIATILALVLRSSNPIEFQSALQRFC